MSEKIHFDANYLKAEVVWAARYEMARTVEDFLARRIRILFLDARIAIESAPVVAELLAKELNKDQDWKLEQIQNFNNTASNYLLDKANVPKIYF